MILWCTGALIRIPNELFWKVPSGRLAIFFDAGFVIAVDWVDCCRRWLLRREFVDGVKVPCVWVEGSGVLVLWCEPAGGVEIPGAGVKDRLRDMSLRRMVDLGWTCFQEFISFENF